MYMLCKYRAPAKNSFSDPLYYMIVDTVEETTIYVAASLDNLILGFDIS
jgi:hypothetical protein